MAQDDLTEAAWNGDTGPAELSSATDRKRSNWGKAKAVLTNVQLSQAFTTLRDMNIDAFIEPTCLKSIKLLGEGAYAVVQQAWYTRKGSTHRTKVAVKYLRKELFSSPDDLALFAQEVELMNKLKHRNIVEFIGAGELLDSSLSAYVVQEYMAGGTVKQLVTKQMLSNGGRVYNDAEGLDICLQMARGLKYLHNSKPMVIHRDLKLENVLIKGAKSHGKYEVKLADFGLSKRVDVKQAALKTRRQASESKRKLAEHMPAINELEAVWTERVRSQASFVGVPSGMTRTRSKELLQSLSLLQETQKYNLTGRTGSLMYMAPEVFKQLPYNEKADVFSFAMMMYEIMQQYIVLLAVSVQGTYEELEEYCARVAGGYRPPLLEKWPPELISVITDCWAADPAARPSMTEVVARLEDIQSSGVLQQPESAGCSCCIS